MTTVKEMLMPLRSKPIFIERPDETYYCGPGFVPYYYKDELKEKGDK